MKLVDGSQSEERGNFDEFSCWINTFPLVPDKFNDCRGTELRTSADSKLGPLWEVSLIKTGISLQLSRIITA